MNLNDKFVTKKKKALKKFINKKNKFSSTCLQKTRVRAYFLNPFIKSLRFHQDSILKILPHPKAKNVVFSGSADGEICSWLLNREKCLFNMKAHKKCVRGLSINYTGQFLLSCSDDNTLKLWKVLENRENPERTYESEGGFNSVNFNPMTSHFLTTGKSVIIWDFGRFIPIQKIFQKEVTISCAKFNPLEFNVILSSSSNRSITLHDLRLHSPVKNFSLEMRTNDIIWSKINPWEFTVANEDSNLYTFDIRKINQTKKIFKGHVMPVQSLDQDGSSDLLVSGSLDRTIRIYKSNSDSEVFSSSRMSRVLCVSFSSDFNVILSGSEDGNLRLWKRPQNKLILCSFQSKKKENMTGINSRAKLFSKNGNKVFLPKIIRNIAKIKAKLKISSQIKRARLSQNIIPGTIYNQGNFKKPTLNF
jgi:WD repeat and SOF domain-containing protein 1